MKFPKISILLFGLPVIFVVVSLAVYLMHSNNEGVASGTQILLGTVVEIKIAKAETSAQARSAIRDAFREIERIEKKFSIYKPHSRIAELNRSTPAESVKVDGETSMLLDKAKGFGAITGGAFDVTVRPLVDLWRASELRGQLPSDEEIKQELAKVGSHYIVCDRWGKLVRFLRPGMKIDMGGIAKGYSVDRAVEKLKKAGIKNAIVDAGGDIYCMGRKNQRRWVVGIQHPREKGKLIGELEVSDKAVATSGDYERFYQIGGRRYSHIIDPKTGRPVGSRPASVTVIAPDCISADAIATALMVMGLEKGMKLIEELKGFEAIFIMEENGGLKIYTSEGVREGYAFREI